MTYEQFLCAICLWREARGYSRTIMVAILHVMMNRRTDLGHRWSRTLTGVICQPDQFSSFNAGDPNATKFPQPPQPGNLPSPDWKAFQQAMEVVMSEHEYSDDPTRGATNYESCQPGKLPSWALPDKMTLQAEPFRFYKL